MVYNWKNIKHVKEKKQNRSGVRTDSLWDIGFIRMRDHERSRFLRRIPRGMERNCPREVSLLKKQ